MSTFNGGNGRRGPNVAQYIRNLNSMEPVEEPFITDEELQRELAIFTNTQFYDFDSGQNTDFQAPPAKPESVVTPGGTEIPGLATTTTATDDMTFSPTVLEDFPNSEFAISGDFNFGEYGSTYTSPTIPSFPNHLGNLQAVQPNSQSSYPPPTVSQRQQQNSDYAAPAQPIIPAGGQNHAQVQVPAPAPGHVGIEEQTRRLAEEDKRRRNTAASARFRVKKKQREQALEKSAKEMSDKVSALENRISTLETENQFLRGLIMDKHGKEEISQLLNLASMEAAKRGKGHAKEAEKHDRPTNGVLLKAAEDKDKSPARGK